MLLLPAAAWAPAGAPGVVRVAVPARAAVPIPGAVPGHRAATLAWLIFFVVALAAGVSGVALVSFPASTGSFFSWPLGPPPLAALIGTCYLVATATYAAGLRAGGPYLRWPPARGLLVGVTALAVPVFVVTLLNLDVFDFARWQAWAWVVLLGLFSVAGPR